MSEKLYKAAKELIKELSSRERTKRKLLIREYDSYNPWHKTGNSNDKSSDKEMRAFCGLE
jgi:hypothetical protein